MAVYIVTGKLGSGKSLAAVGRIRDYMERGRRIATNLDLDLMKMPVSQDNKAQVVRVPDKPRLEDLELLGTGDGRAISEYVESEFGLLVLDELGSWFNSRSWSDKGRAGVLEWFLHCRKMHWDVLLLVQSIDVIDKQLRETLAEHLVVCKRLDRLAVPLIGSLAKLLTGKAMHLPQYHVGTVYYGPTESDVRVDRWWYRARELYGAYMTGQVFRLDQMFNGGEMVDMRASYSLLTRWHLVGRYNKRPSISDFIIDILNPAYRVMVYLMIHFFAMVTGRSPAAVAKTWLHQMR